MKNYLLAIDQGTTSSRAIIFSNKAEPLAIHQIDLPTFYPQKDWVEQDPQEMWENTLICCREVLSKTNLSANDILSMGITNQRETTIIWDKKTSEPIYPAIVWQDRRTLSECQKLRPLSETIFEKTGLTLDPYFSATKISWILNNIPDAKRRAENGELLFGTVDCYLLWKFSKGKVHATDATNASRTMLFNIHTQQWDDDLLNAFNIPDKLLPQVFDSSGEFGFVNPDFLGEPILIGAMIGDQQAATVGQACFKKGMVKSTYGTGCFMLLNTGEEPVKSKNHLLTTIAYRLYGKVTYGLEGSIFSAGATIKWLRDQLKLIHTASESEDFAQQVKDTHGVYLVPAFCGLGAPFWKKEAGAIISGLTFDSQPSHIVRAALEAVVYQTFDLLLAMREDNQTILNLRVDGGMTANHWLMQFLADMTGLSVYRSSSTEVTAQGAALLCGLHAGLFKSLEEISALWTENKVYLPTYTEEHRKTLYSGWKKALEKVLTS